MSEDREFYASTVDEAVSRAATELGVAADELDFRVLDEGSAGFLGMGARDARIAVQIPEDRSPSGASDEEIVPAEPGGALDVERDYAGDGLARIGQEDPEAGGRLDSSADRSDEGRAVAPQDLLEEVEALVTSVLDGMGFRAGVDVYDADGYIAVDVAPDNTALFIGQKGETIDALQYLVNVAAYRERPFVKRIVLDAEGYRQRRVEALQGMAHRTARRAVREHRPVELPPMNSSERRVVHLFLQENPKVTTQSEGTGDNRRVRVLPL